MKRLFAHTTLLSIAVCVINAAAAVSFSVSPAKPQGTTGEQFVVTAVIASDKELTGLAAPALPGADWFQLLRTGSNQSSSSSVRIVNGEYARTTTINYIFQYVLLLKKEGTFTIPALTTNAGGEIKTSQPVTITVTKPGAEEQGLVSLSASINRNRLYIGEQGVLTVRFASRDGAPININPNEFGNSIAAIEKAFGPDFSVSRLFTNQLTQSTATINGAQMRVLSLSFAVIPLKAGTFALPAIPFNYELVKQARGGQRDPFDDFFGGDPFFGGSRYERVGKTGYTNPLTVTAVQPPASPANYSGAVGSFSLSAKVNTPATTAGQGITLTVTHSGTARPNTLGELAVPPSPDLEIFTPEVSVNVDTTPSGIRTTKTSKYLVVPRREGEITIPPLSFCYFDPSSSSYKTASTQPITLTVARGTNQPQSAMPTGMMQSQNDIKQLASDIRWIRTPAHLRNHSARPWSDPALIVTLILPFIILIFAALLKLQQWLAARNPAGQKRKRAHAVTSAALKAADEKHNAADAAEAFIVYLIDAFTIPARGATREELVTLLTKRKLPESAIKKTTAFLDAIDALRFSGGQNDPAAVSTLIASAKAAIDTLESERGAS